MILLFMVLILASVLASSAASLISEHGGRLLSFFSAGAIAMAPILGLLISAIAAFFLFLAIFRIVPNAPLSLGGVCEGALLSSVLFVLTLQLFPLYTRFFGAGFEGGQDARTPTASSHLVVPARPNHRARGIAQCLPTSCGRCTAACSRDHGRGLPSRNKAQSPAHAGCHRRTPRAPLAGGTRINTSLPNIVGASCTIVHLRESALWTMNSSPERQPCTLCCDVQGETVMARDFSSDAPSPLPAAPRSLSAQRRLASPRS